MIEPLNTPDSNLNIITPAFEFDKYGIGVEDIKTEAEQLLKQGNEAKYILELYLLKFQTLQNYFHFFKKKLALY